MDERGSYIHFATVGGTYVDFGNLDLSPWRIIGGLVENSSTEDFIRSVSTAGQADRNWKRVKDLSQSGDGEGGSGLRSDWEYMNLLWPIDFDNPPSEDDYFEAIAALRVIHPSELYILNTLGAQYFQGKGIDFSSWSTYSQYHWYKYQNPHRHYFHYPADHLQETNTFLAFFKENYTKRDYIRNAIRYYLDSFNVNSVEMSFICLCICLETIVPGAEQLSYRLRRNLSVLCSDSSEMGEKIYNNANLLYGFRSKLVHSGMTSKDFEVVSHNVCK